MSKVEVTTLLRSLCCMIAKVALGFEIVLAAFALFFGYMDPLAGLDPPPAESDDRIGGNFLWASVAVNAMLGQLLLGRRWTMRRYTALRRVSIVSIPLVHFGLAWSILRTSPLDAFLIGAALAVSLLGAVLAYALGHQWTPAPISSDGAPETRRSVEDAFVVAPTSDVEVPAGSAIEVRPSQARRTAAAIFGVGLATASLGAVAWSGINAYRELPVAVDMQAMKDGRVAVEAGAFDSNTRRLLIVGVDGVVSTREVSNHYAVSGGISSPSPSGELVAYEDREQNGVDVMVIIDADGNERQRMPALSVGPPPMLASDTLLLQSDSWPKDVTTVVDVDSLKTHKIDGWSALAAWDAKSALMFNDNAIALVDLASGDVISQEPAPRQHDAARSADGPVRVAKAPGDPCSLGWELPRGTLRIGLPGAEKNVPFDVAGESASSVMAVATSSVVLVGSTSSSECRLYGRLYAVDVKTGNVLTRVLQSYRPDRVVALAPDGSAVAYTERNHLYVQPTVGGSRSRIDDSGSRVGGDIAWADDGSLWFVSDMRPAGSRADATLWRRSADGELRAIAQLD